MKRSSRITQHAKGSAKAISASLAIAIALVNAQHTNAQDNSPSADANIEEVTVTGSRIRRKQQEDFATPLSSYSNEDFAKNGANDIRDLVELLPINSGAQNNADNLTQNFTAGTNNINLRGLGVSATLVLLNGKRQVLSAAQTNDGASFVDTAALVPKLAIERVEILKDGASAVYGSDTVAGVANFITRDNFQGAEFQAEYRERASDGDQSDINFDLAVGGDFGESGHMLIAASYLKRTSLVGNEVDWMRVGDSNSGSGNPMNFVTSQDVVADPDCEADGGILDGTRCRFDFGPQITLVPNEQRLQGFARATWDWDESTRVWTEIGFARNAIDREVSPSFPVLSATTVPADHPNFDPRIISTPEELRLIGRPYGANQPTEVNFYDHHTTRFAIGADGDFSDSLRWEFSYVAGQNDLTINLRDVNVDNYQRALNGFGGRNCQANETGARNNNDLGCFTFNPFDTQQLASTTLSNGDVVSPDGILREYIIGEYLADAESTLKVAEFVISGEMFELAGGEAGFALGVQHRQESLKYVYDHVSINDGWGFLIGNPNFEGDTEVSAVFAEVLLPFTDSFEVSAALRHEDYGDGVGSTTDPKLSALWRPSEGISLRSSISTSFRAPSVFQTSGVQTNFSNFTDDFNLTPNDPTDDVTTFGGERANGDPNLDPETSTAFNFGTTLNLSDNIKLSADYWRFEFEDVLTKENAQSIVAAENAARLIDPNDFDERIQRNEAGLIQVVNVAFINANELETDGIDLSLYGTFESDVGTFIPSLDLTYVLSYDITQGGVTIDGVGSRNGTNVGNPTPELRGNLGLNWYSGAHSANIFARYVDSYRNDGRDTATIDEFITFDAQYSIDLGDFLRDDSQTTLTIGAVNITDEDPPHVNISGSYDSRTHDPRGRRVYVRVGTKF